MNPITASLDKIRQRIAQAEARFGREPGSVTLLAVSKTQPVQAVSDAMDAGQEDFGENQLQDALTKLEPLSGRKASWHFIGPVQANKTRAIATHFDWVHSLDRARIAERLNEHREGAKSPLNVCIQVNISAQESKSGVSISAAEGLVELVSTLPNLRLRGLMAIPEPCSDFEQQCEALRPLPELRTALQGKGYALDTLSMGMTADLDAAIAQGSTIVRIGTAIFGPRRTPIPQ
ncbi:MAG: pyridoxal phosphate enzyme (YggS family) [Gammaproteobacteria bacterium]|jgi:pyridoxal phosphate enzyme (YggS family)